MESLSQYKIRFAGFFDSRMQMNFGEGAITPDRRVDCYETEIFLSDGGAAFTNGSAYEIKMGDVLVAKPNQMRHSRLNFKAAYIHIEVFSPYMKRDFDALPDFSSGADTEKCKQIIADIAAASETETESVYITAKLYELLNELALVKRGDRAVLGSDNVIAAAKKYMEENYALSINLSQIAKQVNLSPVYFHRLFREKEKMTPIEFLRGVRLRRAKEMLETTLKSVEQIGVDCGFSSCAYFCDFFKRHTALSPTQYRKIKIKNYKI